MKNGGGRDLSMLHTEGDGHESDGDRRNFNRAMMRGGQRIDNGCKRGMCGSKMLGGALLSPEYPQQLHTGPS